jgi:hypothetical protein
VVLVSDSVGGSDLIQLHWTHPNIGEISETVCGFHDKEVRNALFMLGIGCLGSDGTVPTLGAEGPGEMATCLRCQAGPALLPRQLLRQWFGGEAS